MRLNIGSHNKKIDGFLSVDILPLEHVDIVMDITEVPWTGETKNGGVPEGLGEVFKGVFMNDSVDEIVMIEVLEHISFYDTEKVLREMHRVLKPGGKLSIQVPDCGSMMEFWYNNRVCDCVAHKPKTEEDALGKSWCKKCDGAGRVHPTRWLMAFCGAQKDYGYGILPDIHKNIFTAPILEEHLTNVGFSKIDFKEDPLKWKLIVNVIK